MRRFSLPLWVSIPLCLASINLLSNCAVETSNVFIALYAQKHQCIELTGRFHRRRARHCFTRVILCSSGDYPICTVG